VKDNRIRLHINRINIDSEGILVKKADSKFLNRKETHSTNIKNLIKFSKFSKTTVEDKKSIIEINNSNNRSDIKNLILEATPIEINISNTEEKCKINNCESKINLIPTNKSSRVYGNSQPITEFKFSKKKCKSDYLDNN